MPSAAEERIRLKVEQMMRAYWPAGRIIHELQCGQGENRLDVACVTDDRLVIAEVKSELDVMKRAPAQMTKALLVGTEVWLCISDKHEAKFDGRWTWARRAKVYVERSREPKVGLSPTWKAKEAHYFVTRPDPYQLFDLLWADEMRYVIGLHFGGATLPGSEKALDRYEMTRLAVEHLSGREIRRAVCMMLRARHFPRADEPTKLESFDA